MVTQGTYPYNTIFGDGERLFVKRFTYMEDQLKEIKTSHRNFINNNIQNYFQ